MGKVKELMYGDTITTVGQLRHIMKDLDDHDQLCIETIDLETGDVQDLYPMYVDVIDNVRLTDDTIVREVRFCQRPNVEPDSRDNDVPVPDELPCKHGIKLSDYDVKYIECMESGQHLKSCDDDGFCNNCGHQ